MVADSTYRLPAVMDVQATGILKRHLMEQIECGGSVVIDAEALERVSTPALQCLIAAQIYFAELGRDFSIARPAPCLLAAVADMGIHELLGGVSA